MFVIVKKPNVGSIIDDTIATAHVKTGGKDHNARHGLDNNLNSGDQCGAVAGAVP
jgi:hypothetical protein